MNDRNFDQLLDAWMDLGPTVAPARVSEAVRLEARSTRQTAILPGWPAWRFTNMNQAMRIALASAAVLAVALIAIGYFGGQGVGGPGLGDPTPLPTPTATPQPLADGPLEAGIVIADGLGPSESVSATFTVPEGWEGFVGACVLPATGTVGPDGMGICFGEVNTGLYSDPCNGGTGSADVAVGPTVEELATALGEQTAYEATAPTDVTLGGYSGQRMDLQLPSDVTSCDNGEFYPWAGSIYAQGSDNRWHLWILDVDGDRLVIMSTSFAGTSAEDLAEQQAIVDSIQLEP